MEITLENHPPYTLDFQHYLINREFFKNREKQQIQTIKTVCLISQENENLAFAEIICGSSDVPQKLFGNMKALAKTLELLPITREEKKEFWKQFNEKLDVSEI